MDQAIKKTLKKNYAEGVFHTHVTMGSTGKGRYSFNREQLENLWDIYCDVVEKKPESSLNIAEKLQQYLPVLGDIDIKVKETEDMSIGDFIHTDKHVKATVEVYQSVLRYLIEDCTEKHLICVVLEKPLYRVYKGDDSYAKHGFHIHFPYCFLDKVDQEVHVVPRIQTEIDKLGVFKDLGFDDARKVIDSSCYRNPWLMYGSVKDEGMDPYKVEKIYNSEMKEISLEAAFKNYNIYDNKEQTIDIRGNIKSYLPRILSVLPYGRDLSKLKHGLISPLKERVKKQKNERSDYQNVTISQALDTAKQLLPMLSDFRVEDRNEWLTIGWILYNIGDGTPEAQDLWCEFSSRIEEHYDESRCLYEWDRMIKKGLTMGTLKHYANLDSPERYKEYKDELAKELLKDSLDGSHNNIAQLLYSKYGDEFVCASISSKTWFQFSGNKWEEIENGVYLSKKISGEIADDFTKIGQVYIEKLNKSTDKGMEAMYNTRLKQAQKMINNLKSAPYKSNVMKECAEVFYDKRFREKLDVNPYLFPFKNGVYDLKLNLFRQCRPEDFISKTAPINYPQHMTKYDEEISDVENFLEKIFPDKSLRRYFLDVSSDIFMGGNTQKEVYFWTGEGDNGKSITQSIFEKMLGKLSIKFNTTLITGKKVQSGQANPELARAGGGVRWAVLEEPNGDEQINVGILKNLSGNDSYYARDLFEKGKEGREITPMFKLVFICNKLPGLRNSDKAAFNRIRVIPYESTFCREEEEAAPDTYEEQLRQKRFPMDKEFSKKIPGMVEAFAWYLLEHRKTVSVRFTPEKVKVATSMYRRENDIYRQFIEECVMDDKKSVITLIELYSQFKEWFRDSLPNHTMPIKNQVADYFSKLWGDPMRGKKWKGYRIRTLQDEIENGDAVILDEEDLVVYDIEDIEDIEEDDSEVDREDLRKSNEKLGQILREKESERKISE